MTSKRLIREIRPQPKGGIEEHGKRPPNPPQPPKAQQNPPSPPSNSGQSGKSK
jgi:hypothetical protein